MKCPKCQSVSTIKKGKRNGHQRRYCTCCKHYFQESYTYGAYLQGCDQKIVTLLKEGVGVRSVSRILRISKTTVIKRIRSIAKELNVAPICHTVQAIEVDELWTYVGCKKCFSWITYGIDRATKKVLALHVGRKTSAELRPFITQLMQYHPTKIYTDRLNIYPKLIPKAIHSTYRYGTNRIERHNLTLRTHIKRLSRKTICFSRAIDLLIAHLRLYFWYPAYPDRR